MRILRRPPNTVSQLSTPTGVLGDIGADAQGIGRVNAPVQTGAGVGELAVVSPRKSTVRGSLRRQVWWKAIPQPPRETAARLHRAGFTAVWVTCRNEASEMLRLTCLEAEVRTAEGPATAIASVGASGTQFVLDWPAGSASSLEPREGADGRA